MTVQEMLNIIKDEKLYRYNAFQIGPPNADSNIGTYRVAETSEGMYEEQPGVWREYSLDERETPYVSPQKLSETEACESLLASLRRDREKSSLFEKQFGRSGYTIKNREKWFD